MCDVVTAITAAVSLYQGYQQNRQAKAQAKYQEHTGRYNARQQENQAIKTRNKGVEEENRQRAATAELLSRQRAQFGAAGVQLDSGSALQLQEDTSRLGELDALRIRGNYADEASSMDEQSRNTLWEGKAQASMTRAEGKAALTGGVLSAGGAVAKKWYSSKSALTQKASTNSGGNFHSNAYQRSLRVA